jgi:hypothetical protein
MGWHCLSHLACQCNRGSEQHEKGQAWPDDTRAHLKLIEQRIPEQVDSTLKKMERSLLLPFMPRVLRELSNSSARFVFTNGFSYTSSSV